MGQNSLTARKAQLKHCLLSKSTNSDTGLLLTLNPLGFKRKKKAGDTIITQLQHLCSLCRKILAPRQKEHITKVGLRLPPMHMQLQGRRQSASRTTISSPTLHLQPFSF